MTTTGVHELSSKLPVAWAGVTDTGRVRTHNEDAFTVFSSNPDLNINPNFGFRECVEDGLFLVVSDGMGGAQGGETASRMIVEELPVALRKYLPDEKALAPAQDSEVDEIYRQCMIKAVHEVHEMVLKTGQEDPLLEGMGATLSLAYLVPGRVYLLQVGDSRIYRFRDSGLKQLTRDQSPVGRLRQDGVISEEEARTHPYRSLIDQAMGASEKNLTPDFYAEEIRYGDMFLLCSDGLTDGLFDDIIAQKLKEYTSNNKSLLECNDQLLADANKASGSDNITILTAAIVAQPASARSNGTIKKALKQLFSKNRPH